MREPVSAWSELSWQQLFGIWKLYLRYATSDGAQLRLDVFCMLAGIEPTGELRWNEEEGIRELAVVPREERDGLQRLWCRIKDFVRRKKAKTDWISSPYFTEAVLRYTKFLESPYGSDDRPSDGLLSLPAQFVRLGGRSYHLPSALLTSVTYEQFTSMQACMDDPVAFLSHALVPMRWAWTERVGENYRIRLHRSYEYNAGVAETLQGTITNGMKRGKIQEDEVAVLHAILMQYLQSCICYYKTQFPDLFHDGGKKDDRDPMIATASAMNAVMKYAGYTRQNEVYESVVIFVLEIMNSMAKEAHEIEKLNAKHPKK